MLEMKVPGSTEPVNVNRRYLVTRGEGKSVVYYWYQSPHRTVADEFAAKFYLVWDSMRYRRSDTSLVRVMVPPRERGEVADGEAGGIPPIGLSTPVGLSNGQGSPAQLMTMPPGGRRV